MQHEFKIFLLTLLLTFALQPPVKGALPEAGQVVRVIFVDALSTLYPDNEVIIAVDEDIYNRANRLVISAGTRIEAEVHTKKARRLGRPGQITISFISTTTVDGIKVPLTGSMTLEGDNKKAEVFGIGIGTAFLATPMILYLLKKGGEVFIPAGRKSVAASVAENSKAM
jgi:hypothetical protein